MSASHILQELSLPRPVVDGVLINCAQMAIISLVSPL